MLPFRPVNDKGIHFAATNGLQGIFSFFKAKAEGLQFS
jgi:hypothetical protein